MGFYNVHFSLLSSGGSDKYYIYKGLSDNVLLKKPGALF